MSSDAEREVLAAAVRPQSSLHPQWLQSPEGKLRKWLHLKLASQKNNSRRIKQNSLPLSTSLDSRSILTSLTQSPVTRCSHTGPREPFTRTGHPQGSPGCPSSHRNHRQTEPLFKSFPFSKASESQHNITLIESSVNN